MKQETLNQLALVDKGLDDAFMSYIGINNFNDEAEIRLIERGNHDEIVSYVCQYDFCQEAVAKLAERGDVSELLIYNWMRNMSAQRAEL